MLAMTTWGPSMTSSVEERLFIRHFGVGSEQFRRELEVELEEATPEQRAEFEQLVDQANEVLPGMHATLDRVDKSVADLSGTMRELRHNMAMLDKRVAAIEVGLSPFENERPK